MEQVRGTPTRGVFCSGGGWGLGIRVYKKRGGGVEIARICSCSCKIVLHTADGTKARNAGGGGGVGLARSGLQKSCYVIT